MNRFSLVPERFAAAGSLTLKNSCSWSLTRSQGGLPITQEKPPDQPVCGSMSVSAVAYAEDVGEFYVPVEEAVLAGEVGYQVLGGG